MSSFHLRLKSFDIAKSQMILTQGSRMVRCAAPKTFIGQLEAESRRSGTLIFLRDVREETDNFWTTGDVKISNRESFNLAVTDYGGREGKFHIFAGKPIPPQRDLHDGSYGFQMGDIVLVKAGGAAAMGLSKIFQKSSDIKPADDKAIPLYFSNLQETSNMVFEQKLEL